MIIQIGGAMPVAVLPCRSDQKVSGPMDAAMVAIRMSAEGGGCL
ncbi:hypothetical protein [Paracraurococcus ruber]|nr:hypothetical protein [Paracraurococcus ruber]